MNASTDKPKRRRRKPNQFSDGELRRIYTKYIENLSFGINEIINLPALTQTFLWHMVLQDNLYNSTTNPFLHQMYQKNVFPFEEDMPDTQLTPLLRKKLFNGFENLIAGGGRKKFEGVLQEIQTTFNTGEFK